MNSREEKTSNVKGRACHGQPVAATMVFLCWLARLFPSRFSSNAFSLGHLELWYLHGLSVLGVFGPSLLASLIREASKSTSALMLWAYKFEICNHFRNKQSQSVKVEIGVKII